MPTVNLWLEAEFMDDDGEPLDEWEPEPCKLRSGIKTPQELLCALLLFNSQSNDWAAWSDNEINGIVDDFQRLLGGDL
jgi:hypothetical protein